MLSLKLQGPYRCCQTVSASALNSGKRVFSISTGFSRFYQFKIPQELDKYIVKKGSVAINGASLTVNEIKDCVLSVNLIPHTLKHTNLRQLKQGEKVNIEIDTIARYVEKMVNPQ